MTDPVFPSKEKPLYLAPWLIDFILESTDPANDRYKLAIAEGVFAPFGYWGPKREILTPGGILLRLN